MPASEIWIKEELVGLEITHNCIQFRVKLCGILNLFRTFRAFDIKISCNKNIEPIVYNVLLC